LYYDKIDYDIIKKSWNLLSPYVKLPYIIHIVGTNGKGSTGRYLSSLLLQLNQKVLHYSSPHILQFNERIWIEGEDSTDDILNNTHLTLQSILPKSLIDKLTYFEYTTLLALYLSSGKDYLILEAGLGGEFDATNVVENDFTIITTLGLDHQNFLGNTIELIAATKMRSCDNRYVLANQVFPQVNIIKNDVLSDKIEVKKKNFVLKDEDKTLPLYLQNNLEVVLTVLDYLEFSEFNYALPFLFGRYQRLETNIIIDVGHNPLAAEAIAKELKKENKKYILIYNSFEDKNFKKVLDILHPYLSEVQILDCDDKRIIKKSILEKTIRSLSLTANHFDIINIRKENYYLVFGSFIVVENFLKEYAQYEKR
jgi:dihydrofolate synthase/folylpolyglutamate synthase